MDKKKDNPETEKDYYSRVIICQIVLCILLLLFVFFFRSDGVKKDFHNLMSKTITSEDFTSLAEVLKNYFHSESSLRSVFGYEVTDSSEETAEEADEDITEYMGEKESSESANDLEENTTDLTNDEKEPSFASGGEDIAKADVPANCTFAPLKLTAPILNPIENGRYTSPFGFRTNPITGEYGFHTGLDIAAAEGTRIRAAFSGTVTKIGEDSRAGKYIFLTHDDGLVTFYCHCSEIVAELNANIRQGETIALVGTTGWSTGPHLHFEVRKDNIRYDPLKLLENEN